MKISMRMFKRKNGYYYYEFERDKPRSLKTKNIKIARRRYNRKKKEYLDGIRRDLDDKSRITIKEFETRFFSKHTDIADKTFDAYELAFKLLSEAVGKNTLLSRINEKKIAEFKTLCIARGVKKVSVNTYLRHIKAILNKAYGWGDISKKVRVEFFKLPKRHPRILTTDERKAILKRAKKKDPEMYRVIKFALYTGARREEIAGLKWQDVGEETLRLIGKGDKERTIPILDGAREAMGQKKDIGYVFIHFNDLSKYTKAFKSIARKCGIEDVHLHHTRHTFATQMLKSGVRLETVKEWLGHEDIKTTEIYAKILQETLVEEGKKFSY